MSETTDKLILDTIFANIQILVAYMDTDFNFIKVNKAYAQAGGHPPEYFINKNHFDLYPDRENERIFNKVIKTGIPYNVYEKAFVYPDQPEKGITYWDWSAHPVKGDDGHIQGLVLCLVDVTEKRKAREALEDNIKKLEQSNKELEDFAYISSHDLQEPLRKIQTFGGRLMEKYKDSLGDEGIDYLERMSRAATRMRTLIDGLLTYARVTTKGSPFSRININDVIREALSNLETLIEETGGTVDIDDKSVTLEGDYTQMLQLFQNIIGNSLKFHRTDLPPIVKIRAELVPDQMSEKEGREDTPKNCIIMVKDNGIGFDNQYQDQIFEPFQRLHGRFKYEGTGMGLAICHKIVKRHSGEITVKSSPGKGTSFFITLPLKQDKTGTIKGKKFTDEIK